MLNQRVFRILPSRLHGERAADDCASGAHAVALVYHWGVEQYGEPLTAARDVSLRPSGGGM